MGARLYVKLQNKREANKADKFLESLPENKTLREVEMGIYITCAKDIREAKRETPAIVSFFLSEFGESTISMLSSPTKEMEEKNMTLEELNSLRTKVLVELNKNFEVKYLESGTFTRYEYYFTIEQAKKITDFGKLLELEDFKGDHRLKVLLAKKEDIKPSKYKAGDEVLLHYDLEKRFEINPKAAIASFIGKKVTIDFACIDGTYFIKEDDNLQISDDFIDCKVDEVEVSKAPQISSSKLLAKVKASGEDFEWYPTTEEIIEEVYKNMLSIDYTGKPGETYKSILDIGAGNGKLFATINKITQEREARGEKAILHIENAYAIEKSQVLLNSLSEDIFVLGTDFNTQTLIDKKVDIIFCNPPYSQYEEWSERIIKEANCETVFLVIPKRWVNSRSITNALEARKANAKIVGEFDFESSKDRQARAKVSLLKIVLKDENSRNADYVDPFDAWFDSEFKPKAQKDDRFSEWRDEEEKKKKLNELTKGRNLIERLEELYNTEFGKLIENYKKVSSLDANLLKELDVSVHGLKKALKLKIKGLKRLYWQELFDHMDSITDKLTSSSRKQMLEKLTSSTNLDYTRENAYAIVLWAIRNANKYYDAQLLEVYYNLTKEVHITLYKSNKHLVEDGWRYEKKNMSHYALEYRIVHYHYDALEYCYNGNLRGMGNNAKTTLRDIIVVAKNLGFNVTSDPDDFEWQAGKTRNFLMNFNGEVVTFMEVKAFKNGNLHFKFNKEFMKAFNLEAARLNGWIKSPKEASEEFDITEEEASKYFKGNYTLLPSSMKTLLPNLQEEKEDVPPVDKAANNVPYDNAQIEKFAKTGTLF